MWKTRWIGLGLGVLAAACGEGVDQLEPRGDRLAERPLLREVAEAAQSQQTDPLRDYFDHPDPSVRARAAFHAGAIGNASLVSPLIRLLSDSVGVVREDAAFALAHTGVSPDAEAALLARLGTETSPDVLSEIGDALGFVGGDDASLALVDPAIAGRLSRAAATDALARMSARGVLAPAALDSLMMRLSDVDAEVRRAAARGIASAQGPDIWIRTRARVHEALAAYGLDDPAARPLLAAFGRLLPRTTLARWRRQAPDPRTRRIAVQAVARHSDGLLGLGDLEESLSDTHPWVREAAALGLAGLAGSDAAFAVLEAAVTDEADPATEEAWLRALAARGRLDVLYDRVRGRNLDDVVAWRAAASLLEVFDDSRLSALVATAVASPSPYLRALARRSRSDDPVSAWPRDPSGSAGNWSAADWAELAALGPAPRLEVTLPAGRVVVRLDPDRAPASVLTLARRVAEGAYDGVPVHRVVAGTLAQWGRLDHDPSGPPLERSRLSFRTGVVGWARGAGGSDDDLFVALDDLPELDGRYTAIGWVVEGLDVWAATVEGTPVLSARVQTPP